jgi:hypothetical protein
MAAGAEALELGLLDREWEGVRIIVLVPSAIPTLPAQAIAILERCGRPAPFEKRGVADAREHRVWLDDLGPLGVRQVRAQHDLPAVRCVHAQYTPWLV